MRKAQKLIQKFYGRYHDQSVRRLRILGERAVPDLLEALKSPNPRNRRTAVRVLGMILGPRAIAGIESCLSDPDEEVLIAASHELRDAGVSAERIWSLLHFDSADVCASACGSLAAMRFVEALPDIIRLLDDPSIWVRSSAIRAVGYLGSSDLIDLVTPTLFAEDYRERRAAVHALSRLDESAALPLLIDALYDPEMCLRMGVLGWFEEHPNERARLALEYVRDNDYPSLASTAVELIEELDAQPMSVASQPDDSEALKTVPEQRPTAYLHLQESERRLIALKQEFRRRKSFTTDQLEFLAECLTDYDDHIRATSAILLSDAKIHGAQELLLGCLADPYPGIRSVAISAFDGIEHSAYRADLVAMKSDPNDRVRSSAICALARLTYPEGLKDLIEHSHDDFSVFRMFAATALGKFDDVIAISRLEEMTTDRNMDVRSSAATALGLVGNSNSLPYLMRLRGNDYPYVESSAKYAIKTINRRALAAGGGE